jgi:hypothetical protein
MCTVDVERHAADFMEAAKTLQLYFIRVQHQQQPTREEALRKVNICCCEPIEVLAFWFDGVPLLYEWLQSFPDGAIQNVFVPGLVSLFLVFHTLS